MRAVTIGAVGAVAAASVVASAPAASAASYNIVVDGNAPLYKTVDGWETWGTTDSSGSTALATCKRWSGVWEQWYYWVNHHEIGHTGYVYSGSTNLTHSHLNRCS